MTTVLQDIISPEETIVRLLHQEWVVNGILQQTAFNLRNGETYLSVNRPAVDSYEADVVSFIEQHPKYRTAPLMDSYRRAELNVGEVRNIDIRLRDQSLDVEVEVESRSTHAKSHAGIFTRLDGKNIKGGQVASISVKGGKVVSTEMILQKMRWHLLQQAKVSTCHLANHKK